MNTGQYVGFVLGDEHYGVDIMAVEEIIRMMEITPVPRAPSFVDGIINLRGKVIPVVDLRRRLHIASISSTDNTRIIVMHLDDRRLGFVVDRVEEVMYIPDSNLDHAPGVNKSPQQYVEGVARTAKGMIIILDILKIFTPDEHLQMAKIG